MNIFAILLLIFGINAFITFIVAACDTFYLKRAPFLIVIIFILPLIGFLYYLFFCNNGILYKKSNNIYRSKVDNPDFHDPLLAKAAAFLTSQNYQITNCQEYQLLSVSQFYQQILDDIKNSKKEIFLNYYGIRNDQVGKKLIKALEEKKDVKIGIIYDRFGSLIKKRAFKKLKKNGAIIMANSSRNKKIKAYVNYFDHRKVAIVDDYGYIGSTNFDKRELGLGKIKDWYDTTLRIKGDFSNAIRNDLIDDFENNHHIIASRRPIAKGKMLALVTTDAGGNKENILNLVLLMITNAKESIDIISPFVALNRVISSALAAAIKSGVKVRIIIPIPKDTLLPHLATFSYIKELMDLGVEVYMSQYFDHSKLMIFDNKLVCYGSCNFQYKGFYINFEADTVIFDRPMVETFRRYFTQQLSSTKQLTAKSLKQIVKPNRCAYKIIRLLDLE